ncbi:MotA/TolQ/ExbB proton channel family protein [Vibrio algarum]|uniref:MotA/TolQ/ExbB proton channel family protein n=1 Tax=Vibrio algarum TaxID=3020714 RepID=A0ABT4YS80_9VIBR|nr:MotA/TolQ/ExbB proton channel family protein [Vibrio sp. KJ40-1]MDB1124421.1 MotA/TolQ/ExbB proton channel family protein [Vibrio sp. KJ40-1]
MNMLTTIHSQLGLMALPLTLLSLLTLTLLLERVIFLSINSRTSSHYLIGKIRNIDVNSTHALNELIQEQATKKNTLSKGVALLLAHKNFAKPLREQTVSIWLARNRQQYTSGLRFLSVIGAISPLIGLLGTVLGLIEMFKDLGTTTGAIAPSDLAKGLGLAMSTTAAGLIIAVPAIFGSQILQLWAERSIAKIEHALNHCNLYLEGISLEKVTNEVIHRQPSTDISDSIEVTQAHEAKTV